MIVGQERFSRDESGARVSELGRMIEGGGESGVKMSEKEDSGVMG